ncbi:MAG: thioredoxin family protein [Muribaculaceae bacterium]
MISNHQDWAAEAQVESIPTFINYDNAEEVWRRTGEIDGQVLLDTIDAVLNSIDPDGQ